MLGRDSDTAVVLLRDGVEVATLPLPATGGTDLALVEELARMQLGARRLGCSIRLRNPCRTLVGLIDLVGLAEVLLFPAPLRVEPSGQAEGAEQVGVEEVVVTDDPVA